MTNNEYLQQQYREAMRSRNLISFNDWVAQRNPQSQRTWVGLTKEDKESFWTADQMTQKEWDELYAAIEAALRSKNT